MKRYLIPLTALIIGVGMMGGDELETRRKEIPPRSVRMLQQAGVEPVRPTNSIGFLTNVEDVILIGPAYTNVNFGITNRIAVNLQWMLVRANAQNYVDAAKYFKVLPDLVNLLATTGEVCKVRGHAWKAMPRVTLEVQYGPVEDRQCVVCGKYESRSMPAWPTP